MIAITHTPATGTTLEGTTRGDGTNQLLKPHGWRWSRRQRRFVAAHDAAHHDRSSQPPLTSPTHMPHWAAFPR